MKTCPNCGEENSDRARFCQVCATPLAKPVAPEREERKVVTILFCDLVGFTEASDHADPEDVQARIRPYHARLRPELEAFGGTVEKFIGDAVMAVFGAPATHEDDPERAVRAGLRVLQAISELNESDPGLDLRVRVGIETGEAVVTLGARPERGEGMVIGDAVNTASRLQGVAPVNGVVVGERTYAATKYVFDYEALEPVRVKGKAEPIPLYVAKAARSRLGTDVTRRHSTPLVGRQRERTILTEAFERAARDRSVELVTIVAEPGVGKSRMVAELYSFVETRPESVRWRQGRCLPYGDGVTFWALGEIVKAEAGIMETDSPEAVGAKIDTAVSDGHPDAVWLRQRLRPLVGLEAPHAARDENFAAWRSFLEHLARHSPSVFVFEDLHWADNALVAFLEYLANHAEGVPMLVVATARPEFFERAPTWAATAPNATTINISPLSEAETAELISNLLGWAALPAEVHQAIVPRAGGNPLFAEEFVRLLKDTAILKEQGSTWALDRAVEIPLPTGVHGTIAARLDTLHSDRKRVLQDAAVVGTVFWHGAVASMESLHPSDLDRPLHELSQKELVQPSLRSSIQGELEYSFSHALVRDVCYAQIPRLERAQRHRRAADWIERVAGDRAEDLAEILASHYLTALELARAAKSPDTTELVAKAVRHLTLAGDRAMRMDLEAAERHYARALELMPGDDPGRPQLLARQAEALWQRNRFPEAERAFEEAIEGFRTRDEVGPMAVAMARQSYVLFQLGDPQFRVVSSQALALLEPLGPSPELVRALTEEARTRVISADHRAAIASADRAIAMAEDTGLPEPARALGYRGAARVASGDAGGLRDMRRAIEVAEAQGLGAEVALVHNNLAWALWQIEGPRATLETLREGSEFAERRGIDSLVLGLADQYVWTLVELGAYEEAEALAGEIVPSLEEAKDVASLVEIRELEVRVRTRRGELSQAAPMAGWVVEHARKIGQTDVLVAALTIAAALRLAIGDASGAAALLAEMEETANARDVFDYAAALPEAVRIAFGAGEPHLAGKLVHGVDSRYPLHEHALLTARALLAEHRGEHAAAEGMFADAADRWKRFELPWERAQALLGQGRCLLALNDPGAGEALRQARDILISLGARPALEEADALLERATALTS